jgi:hypothetical protein
MTSPPRARVAAMLVTVALSVAACTGGDDDATPVITVPPTTTEAAPSATDPTTTEPETSTPPTGPDTVAPTVSTAPATTTTTVPPTTTTTEPLAVQELLLRGDGLGSAKFGAAPDGVIDYVTSILGGNTADTGWVDPSTFAACEGTVARRVDWGVLSLLFSDFSIVAEGRRHFMGYEYGRVGVIGDEPVGLRTPGGTTLGTRVVDLLADFPEASVNAGENDVDIPPNFYVSDNFYGLLTGIDPEDVVTVVFGGPGCGE